MIGTNTVRNERIFFRGTSDLLKNAHFHHYEPRFHGIETINLFVFVVLRPKSTAMVMAGRSVHLTTLSPVQA